MIEHLRRLEPFAALDWQMLNTVARHSRVLDLPAGRRLHLPGKRLAGHYYLLRGRLRSEVPARLLKRSRRPVYPGCSGLVAASRVCMLHVDTAPIAFLFEAAGDEGPREEAPGWQHAFLSSHLLKPLPRQHWQQIFRALTPVPYGAGEAVLARGAPADCCYILASGRAQITCRGRLLKVLAPGDFFGEDALLAATPRSATVTMTEAGTVMRLGAEDFERWLADMPIREGGDFGYSNQAVETLAVSTAEGLRAQLAGLDPCACYAVAGPARICRLAVFLLRARGVRAFLASDDWEGTPS